MTNAPIRYEELVAEFHDGLLNAARGHGVGLDFLELWVPDEDAVRSVLNMAESAQGLGTDGFSVQVSRDTLPSARDGELVACLSPLGAVDVQDIGDGQAVVRISGLVGGSETDGLPLALQGGVKRRLAALRHEGLLVTSQDGLALVKASDDYGPALTALLDLADGRRVVDARHAGGRSAVERAALDALCEAIIGAPLQDAAEHGAIRAVGALYDKEAPRPVGGVLLPVNADPAFGLAQRLIRGLQAQYPNEAGARNEFSFPPSAAWLAAFADARQERTTDATATFLAERGQAPGAIQVLRIDNDLHGAPVRVVVTFDAAVAPTDKPALMQALERRLKRDVEAALQLHHEHLKDQNAIRRL